MGGRQHFFEAICGSGVSGLLIAGVVSLAGCAASVASDESDGLQIERTDSALSGRLRTASGLLTFDSVRADASRAELTMRINGKLFEWMNDDSLKLQASSGHGAVLDGSDRLLLQVLVSELEPYLESLGQPEAQEQFPLIAASYWAEAPEGYVHGDRTGRTDGVVLRKSLGDETSNNGIVCVENGTQWTLPYTYEDGSVECDTVTVGDDWDTSSCGSGDYACMGRCGGGCGGIGGGWTMDCLEHDVCSHNLCASGGGSDANCGDEYDDAYDDFTSHMWGGGRCSSGDFSDVSPGTDPECGGGGGSGSVCGNGVVEAGEACDGGECCDASCQLSADGTSCADGGFCEAGVCEPPAGGGGADDTLDEMDLSGGAGTELFFEMIVPEGGADVLFAMSGGTGDADLYVKKGSPVSSGSYDCRPYASGNDESCAGSGAGHYYLMVRGYSAFSGVRLVGSYTPAGSGGGGGGGTLIEIDSSGLAGSADEEIHFTMEVPTGGTDVSFVMSGGTGDADLYVKKGSLVSTSNWDCRPYASGNNESCGGSGAGTYYVMVRGYSAFSSVSLEGSYTSP